MFSKLAMVLCGVLLMAGVARAEHKLLITDVLDKGQFEVEADIGLSYSKNSFTVKSPFFQQGEVSHNLAAAELSLDMGVGHDLEIGISIPYVLKDRLNYTYTLPYAPSEFARSEGWGDFMLMAKYRLVGGDNKPFSLVTGLNIKLDTGIAEKEGSGTTDYNPYLAVSTLTAGGKLRPYAYYSAIFRNHKANDSHILGAGLEYAPSSRISMVPFMNAHFRTNSAILEGYRSYEIGLSNFIRIVSNFYLIPSASYAFSSSTSTIDKSQDLGGFDGYSISLGLYYLFN